MAYFHHVFHIFSLCFDWSSFNDIISLHPLLMQWLNGTWLENYHHQLFILMCPTPIIHTTEVGGLPIADFLEIVLKFVLNLDGNLTTVVP